MKHLNSMLRMALASSLIGAALVPSQSALAQTVSDRVLSDVKVENIGDCTTLTVNFNIRVQLLGYFPNESGRELHIRVRPLDPGGTSLRREALRPPSSVSELRTVDFEGDNPAGPVLSLFFTKDMRFEVTPGRDPRSLVIRLSQPGSGPHCGSESAVAVSPQSPPDTDGGSQVGIPAGLYVVNLATTGDASYTLTDAQRAALGQGVVYETQSDRDARILRRLRLGFFASRAEAESAREALAALFPDAFVISVSAEERAQGVVNRIGGSPAALLAPEEAASAAQSEEAAALVAGAEEAFAEQNYDRAIQLLTNALQLPANPSTPRALELLGLLRERKGQEAQARAEYEEYLRRYPKGEAADRVNQRLAALGSAPAQTQVLRDASGRTTEGAWAWGVRGSFSQFYFRDASRTKFVDAARPDIGPDVDNSVNVNQLLSAGDLTISGGNDQRQIELRASGAYTANFRSGGSDIKSVTALYLDYADTSLDLHTRFGRQARNSAGVLGRFDGALASVAVSDKVAITAVGGFPVLRSRQTFVLTERPFYGASIDVGGKRSPFSGTVYWFDQRAAGGLIDRQSVGLETRVLLPRFNAFTIIDYDVHFSALNLGLATLNYTFPDTANLSLTLDYRQSPLLTTTNALSGQIFTDTLLPVLDLKGLRPFFTDEEIYRLASDRTYTAKSLTLSYSRPIVDHLQANLDFTMTNTGGTPGTPASSGTMEVLPTPATGTEYFYGAQVIGTGLFWENDIYILSGRYSDTQRSTSYTADFNARIPLMSNFRLSPRLRYGRRDSKLIDSRFSQLQPTLRIDYYPMRNIELEVEIGANFAHQTETLNNLTSTFDESGLVLSFGYRVDFR
jgi:tetratricopeptide (TPR) repeat protein